MILNNIKALIGFTQPTNLLLALLTYSLGLGLANYLGTNLQPEAEFAGGAIVLLLLAGSALFSAYFRPPNEPLVVGETPREQEELRRLLLAFGAAFVAAASLLVFLLQRAALLRLDTGLLLVAFVLLTFANALPPLRLVNRGFGEILNAFLIASLTPTLAFLLQADSLHRFVTFFTFSMFLMILACSLALDFPAYAEDLKYERRSLLMALTWQRAVPIHNLLLVASYLLFAAGPFLGISFGLVWPALLTLPLAVYQMLALRNIAAGAKPLWTLFGMTAIAIAGLTTYLLALTFWLS